MTSGERPAGSGFQIVLEVRRLPSRCSLFRSPAMSASFLALVQPFSCDSRFCAAGRDSWRSEYAIVTGRRPAVYFGPRPALCARRRSARSVVQPVYKVLSEQRRM